MNVKPTRAHPSVGLTFNHRTLIKLIDTKDSLKIWEETLVDKNNKHLHHRAAFKVKWLTRKHDLLRKILY